jgi:hypothetical protein
MSFPKCTSCISEFVEAKAKRQVDEGRVYTEDELYEPADLWAKVRDADTLLVSWQEKFIGNQMIIAPISSPVCMKHIGIREPEVQEMAMRSGLALPT